MMQLQASGDAAATVSQPQNSNLLSNENVIAFAPGIVIDDGVASCNHPPTITSDSPMTSSSFTDLSVPSGFSQHYPNSSDKVKEAVINCLRRQENR